MYMMGPLKMSGGGGWGWGVGVNMINSRNILRRTQTSEGILSTVNK